MSAIDQNFDAITTADGICTIEIRPTTVLRPWVVTQVSVEMPGVTDSQSLRCDLRKNGSLITPLAPLADAAAGDPPVTLTQSDLMTVTWSGAPPGAVGLAFVTYDEPTR